VLGALREITRKHGALLVFDEVVTGFRVAPGGAQAFYGVLPDLTAMAKIGKWRSCGMCRTSCSYMQVDFGPAAGN